MTNYKWVIYQLQTVSSENSLIDIVKIIHWVRTAEQFVGGEPMVVSTLGTMNCTTPSETDFTAYPDLTYEQVCGWLDAGLDVPTIDANLDKQIENIINPPIIVLPLPWQSQVI
jgi:hypothetical protein